MSKVFEFADGGRGEASDTATGRVTTWTREDMEGAVLAYCKTHSRSEAIKLFYHACGETHPNRIPPYAFGTVIAMIAQVLTKRPDKGAKDDKPVLRLPQRKDDA